MDTPTLGSRTTQAEAGGSGAGAGEPSYFSSLPVESLGALALATTEEDPFALHRSLGEVDTPRSAGGGKSYEGHVYGAGGQAQPPMDSPESARSSGGESGVLNLDEGEWSFDNLFFRPPPTNADRSILPQPTPIAMHRVSSSSRLTTTPTSSDDGRHALLISPSSTYDRDLVAESSGEHRLSIGESMRGERRSWTGSEASVYSAGEDPTFGRRVGGDLRLSLDDVFRYSQSTARPFEGEAEDEEERERPSSRASETWATAEDGGDEDEEDGQRRTLSPQSPADDLPTPAIRPSPTPAQGDWTASSFARDYLDSNDSQPPSRSHSAPADQLSFIDFTTARDSRQTLTSPTPTRRSDHSSRSGRGSFLEFGDGDSPSPPCPTQEQREVESRSSFLDEWSPPASPTHAAPLSFPVILATSSSDQGHPEATPSPPRLPQSPMSLDEGRFSDEPVQARAQGRESCLSVDSPRFALGARNSSGTLSSSRAGDVGAGTGGSSPMAGSFHSHFSKLDDFPSPPPLGSNEQLLPPSNSNRSTLHPLDRTRDSTQSLRRPRSMPQVPPSPPRAHADGGGGVKRRSSSFLDLYDEASRPLSTASSSSAYSRPDTRSSTSLRPWSTSQSSFATFFSGGGAKRETRR
ncbi:hypothetical protein BCR35DRAFT_298604 [Leucosporidium creatinivorum]|uniref:Uncharacterized protein n=1 Tax=Leucosporidium creatinivorum TaxID=106004 RepID=A0A1Y2G4V4_9BASI|nr:hypothetical protein BCR35DRAFT_298604 [Leucosporidium creatinivorum]